MEEGTLVTINSNQSSYTPGHPVLCVVWADYGDMSDVIALDDQSEPFSDIYPDDELDIVQFDPSNQHHIWTRQDSSWHIPIRKEP